VARDNSPAAVARRWLNGIPRRLHASDDNDAFLRVLTALIAAERGRCARVAKDHGNLRIRGGSQMAAAIYDAILAPNKPPRRGRKEK
jgi:hypothetical protein